jgi:hypothetical protein
MIVNENLIPFHLYAEDFGTYVLAERAREAEVARSAEPADEPAEDAD